jgi:enamine deaminase RidA (YjgF/YER057c/UK114 family)
MTRIRWMAAILALAASAYPFAQKEKKEEITQTLEIPPDPPAAVTAETSRLVFFVSPLSAKGLLSQQVADALKSALNQARGAAIVKLRAFVAGSGDVRRVQSIVSETFSKKKMPIPALSVVQVGALPLVGAQVVIESTAMSKKPLNPLGVAFVSGQAAGSPTPDQQVAPLAKKAAADLKTALTAAGSAAADVLRVTCFCSSLDDFSAVRDHIAPQYPRAPLNFVQIQRGAPQALVECEAVARLQRKIDVPMKLENPQGLAPSNGYSHLALVAAPKVVLTGAQMAYGFEDSDARLAFQRLAKTLDESGSSIRDVAMANFYPLSGSLAGQVRRIRTEFFDQSRPPASTLAPFQGLPAMEAGFAVDVIAVHK